jgi:hypothetical protein
MLEFIVYVSLTGLAIYFAYGAGYSNGIDDGWEQGTSFERRWNDVD